jgi:hypothetical protein
MQNRDFWIQLHAVALQFEAVCNSLKQFLDSLKIRGSILRRESPRVMASFCEALDWVRVLVIGMYRSSTLFTRNEMKQFVTV